MGCSTLVTSTQVTEGFGSSSALRRAFWLRSTIRSASSTTMIRRAPSIGDSAAWATASRIASIGYVYPSGSRMTTSGWMPRSTRPQMLQVPQWSGQRMAAAKTLAASSLPVPGGPANR